jgi:DNA-directed RNA polymerase subunit D
MDAKFIIKNKNKLTFLINGTTPAFVNTLRRVMSTEVPIMTVKNVTIMKNSSALYDEMIAHRLGLVPLTTDLDSYVLTEKCTCKGVGCARCQLTITLKAEGPLTVYASDLKSQDPKIKAVYDNMPIIKLLKGQEIEFEATASLGIGKDHAKYIPCLAHYRGIPEIMYTSETKAKECMKACEGMLEMKGKKLMVIDFANWTDRQENLCEELGCKIENSQTDFVFTIESWGQLSPEELLTRTLEVLDAKVDEFVGQVNKL